MHNNAEHKKIPPLLLPPAAGGFIPRLIFPPLPHETKKEAILFAVGADPKLSFVVQEQVNHADR